MTSKGRHERGAPITDARRRAAGRPPTGPGRRDAGARVVVKVGSSSLTTAAGGLDADRVDALVDALGRGSAAGAEIVLVSSGAIAAGLAPLGLTRRPRDLATQQAAASVGQGLLIARYTGAFARHGRTVGQVLLTADDVTRRAHYRNAQRTLDQLLELGVVPIVNENDTVATDEIRFGDNDRLAALVAHLVHADLLVLLSDVDGLYDGPPARAGLAAHRRGARRPPTSTASTSAAPAPASAPAAWSPRSRRPASPPSAGIPVVLTVGRARRRARSRASRSARSSTRPASAPAPGCSGSRTPPPAAGASRSTPARSRPSCAAAPRCCPPASPPSTGSFVAGDPVDLVDEDGHAVARGLVNFDATELPGLLGPLDPRPGPGAGTGVRARGRPPRRPGAPAPLAPLTEAP